MINRITKGLSLNVMEKNIAAEMSGFEFWGDLGISFEEFEALMERVKDILFVDGVDIEYICKKYPHAITTSCAGFHLPCRILCCCIYKPFSFHNLISTPPSCAVSALRGTHNLLRLHRCPQQKSHFPLKQYRCNV